jgi:hypothetical protein
MPDTFGVALAALDTAIFRTELRLTAHLVTLTSTQPRRASVQRLVGLMEESLRTYWDRRRQLFQLEEALQ